MTRGGKPPTVMRHKSRLTITLSPDLLDRVDKLIAGRTFSNRSQAIEALLRDSLRPNVEAAVILAGGDHDGDAPALAQIGGQSLIERSIRHRLQPPEQRERWVHIDILHHARRRYRGRIPNCRLQTLERHVCLRTREADIPGHAIPGVYAEYVRTGFERDMDTVLYHNALDLVTLFDLAHRLAA